MANPNPSPSTRFQPGQSGNPGGRPKKPDVDALNKLIESEAFGERIARAWVNAALGLNNGGDINVPLFKMLIEYRNGLVPKGDDKETADDIDDLLRDDDAPGPGAGAPPQEVQGRPDPVQ